jgi:hypothetical protein
MTPFAGGRDGIYDPSLPGEWDPELNLRPHQEEAAMRQTSILAPSAIADALGFVASASARDRHDDRFKERGGSVIPCSLVGVNPVHHPEIFGDAAVA